MTFYGCGRGLDNANSSWCGRIAICSLTADGLCNELWDNVVSLQGNKETNEDA